MIYQLNKTSRILSLNRFPPPRVFTKVDTLQARLNYLIHQLDSLNKVTAKNTVATEFYHDVINMNVATFVGIITLVVGIVAIISWTTLTQRFKSERKSLQTAFDERITTHQEQFNTQLNAFEKNSRELKNNYETLNNEIKRAVYDMCKKNEAYETAIWWGLQAVLSSLRLQNSARCIVILNVINKDYKNQPLDKSKIKDDRLVEIKDMITQIKSSPDSDIRQKINDFEEIFFKEIYKTPLNINP